MDLKAIRPHLLYDFHSEHELIESIKLLSKNFTQSRDNIDDYLISEKLVSAYTAFYLLTNIPKLDAVFEMVGIQYDQIAEYEVFDIGAGPGTFSLALLAENETFDLTLIEKSEAMRKQAQKLLGGLYQSCKYRIESNIKNIKEKNGKKRIGIFGHSSNEMGKTKTLNYVESLDLDMVLFIEPGTKDFFEQMLQQRDKLLQNYEISYPCLSRSKCAMSEGDWCHQYLRINHAPDVERLSQLVRKDRRNLPIIIHLYEKKTRESQDYNARIVRVYKPTKFSVEWEICMIGNGENKLYNFQLLLRGFKKAEIKSLHDFKSGKAINIKITKELENNKIRGELI